MSKPRCPGQDPSRWKPEDIFDHPCPGCGKPIEFWKDEPVRRCPGCRREVANPRMNLGCLAWCPAADRCRAELAKASPPRDA